jgi:uncharacterized protein YjiS (DUF1127 family)
VLESRARKQADAAAQPWSFFAWFDRVTQVIASEIRIRRDTRELMDDRMLKDIGITCAEIGRLARRGRNGC